MKKVWPAISMLCLVLFACNGDKRAKESHDQLMEVALEQGDRISVAAQKALGGQLKKALTQGGIPNAVQFCNQAAYPILDTLTTDFEAVVKRTSLRTRNPRNTANETEKGILEDYSRLLSVGNTLKPRAEMLNEKQILYARPILLDNPLCLNCHGQVESQIPGENYALIKKLYPHDEAVDFELGDLRGIWSITFDEDDLQAFLKANQPSQ